MTSRKFAISVHILTLLAASQDEWTPSEYLAGSININPVLVRKELSNLRAYGLVKSKEGKAGGSQLSKSPDKILMNDHLDSLYEESEKALISSLAKTTLSDFCKKFD